MSDEASKTVRGTKAALPAVKAVAALAAAKAPDEAVDAIWGGSDQDQWDLKGRMR